MQVSLRDVSIRFPSTATAVLGPLSVDFQSGELIAIVGPSGCGKSTLLRLVAGLLAPTEGTIQLGTAAGSAAGKDSETPRIGFVFQHPTLLPWRTAARNLALPQELGNRRTRHARRLTVEEQRGLLRQVGLNPEDALKRPGELSGGMQMRLSLARALSVNPDILLLDEPLAAVDDLLRLRLQEDVMRIHFEERLTTILVTHNLHEAVFMGTRVIVLGGSPAGIMGELSIPEACPRGHGFRSTAEFSRQVQQLSAILHSTPALEL